MLSCVVGSQQSNINNNEVHHRHPVEVLIPSDYMMMLPVVKDTTALEKPSAALHGRFNNHTELVVASVERFDHQASSPLEPPKLPDDSSTNFDDDMAVADVLICTMVLAFVALTYRDVAVSYR